MNQLDPYEIVEPGKAHGSIYLGATSTNRNPIPSENTKKMCIRDRWITILLVGWNSFFCGLFLWSGVWIYNDRFKYFNGSWEFEACYTIPVSYTHLGTIIGPHTNVYPLSRVRGQIAANSIFKDASHVTLKD